MGKNILLVGEPMGLFIAQEEALLEDVHLFAASVAGAEFNVAVGLSRLGHSVGYMTKLGNDPFGRRIVKAMEQNRIGTSLITYSDNHATGFMLKSKTNRGDPDIFYYRKNSAASTITTADLEKIDLAHYDGLHITGILPALSASALEATQYLMEKAKAAGITIFFDPNLRPSLWSNRSTMVQELNRLAVLANYVLPGCKEGGILCGTEEPEKIADFYLSRGVNTVIVKIGPKGAYAATKEGDFCSPTYHAEKIVDTVGAGDGFAAGVISGVMEALPLEEAVQRGNAIGTLQVMNASDNEGLPTRRELDSFMSANWQETIEGKNIQ